MTTKEKEQALITWLIEEADEDDITQLYDYVTATPNSDFAQWFEEHKDDDMLHRIYDSVMKVLLQLSKSQKPFEEWAKTYYSTCVDI